MIKEELSIFGVPRDDIAWIMAFHRNCSVLLKVGMINMLMSYGCDVKQWDSLSPTLFIMVIQLAALGLESEFKNNNITMLKALVSHKAEKIIRKHKNNKIKICH